MVATLRHGVMRAMMSDSTHVKRCFDRIADELFKMVMDEEDAALRQGMDTTLDYTINTHRMSMLRAVTVVLGEVAEDSLTDFDKERWMGMVGFDD
jgi:hypothetical protein